MKLVNVGVLLSASLSLARQAGRIIRSVSQSGDLGTLQKGIDDPVTRADVAAQRLIVGGLWSVFPGLALVGEEDTPDVVASAEQPRLDLIDLESVPRDLRAVPLEELCVYIDPLDATKEFTLGKTECVMTLIGITHRGVPVAGVMHQPFAEQAAEEHGHSVYALRDYGVVGLRRKPHPAGEGVVAISTLSHGSAALDAAIARVRPDVVRREGGCGYKALLIAQGVGDIYLYPQPGTKRWDTCAPEAILRAMGGALTDMHGRDFVYARSGDMLNQSLVACLDKALHQRVIESLK
jgi:3'(2'), 5'-bisphosphate nucleotidase